MYEYFDHTADVGFTVRAASRAELYAEAARALTGLLVERPDAVRPAQSRRLTLRADDEADLLHDWLEEILFYYTARRFIFVQFQLELEENEVNATGWGEPLDEARHQPGLDVKAITYHQLRAGLEDGEWVARVIVDI